MMRTVFKMMNQELMALFVDIDTKDFTLYTTCVLKPLQELKNHGWFDPAVMAKLCAKRVAQAEATLAKSQKAVGKSGAISMEEP